MFDEDFAKILSEIEEVGEGDREAAHIEADEVLCLILYKLGYKKTVSTFRSMTKWYA